MARKTRAKQTKGSPSAEPRTPDDDDDDDGIGAPPTAKNPDSSRKSAKKRAPRRVVRPVAAPTESDWLNDLVPLIIGMACAVLPATVEVGMRDLYQLPKMFMMTYCAAWGLLGVAGVVMMGNKLRVPDIPLKWPLVGMVLSIALGVTFAPDETGGVLSLFAKMDAYRWGAGLIICALGLLTVRRPRHVLYILAGMLAGGLFVALVGIGQHHNIRGLLPTDVNRWVGINRPGSSFGNRNMAAQQIVAVFSAALVFLGMGVRWWRRGKSTAALSVTLPATGALFVLLYYLRLSVTRSAWGGALIGLVLGAAIFLVAKLRGKAQDVAAAAALAGQDAPKRSPMPIVAGALAVALLGGVIASNKMDDAKYDHGVGDEKRKMGVIELASTAFDFNKPHWDMRFMMWGTTVEAIKARPMGGGAGNWRVLYPQYVTRREQNDHFSIAKQPVRAHQDFLQFASEYGLQGLFSLLGLIGLGFVLAIKTVTMSRRLVVDGDDGVQWMALSALAGVMGITAICVDALFSFPFQLPAPTFSFCVWVAVIGAAYIYTHARLNELLVATSGKSAPTPGDDDSDKDSAQGDDAAGAMSHLVAVPPGIRLALVVAGIAAVGFVHWENGRLLVAESGFTQARALQKNSNPQGGLNAINGALAINPDDFQNHFIQALCYNSMGRMKEAVASIEASLKLYPNLLNAWVNLAMFSARLGDDNKMNHALREAIALKPDEPYALNVRAEWLRKRRQHAQIVKELEPHLHNPHLNGGTGKANMRYLRNLLRAYEDTQQWAKVPAVYNYMIHRYPLQDYTSDIARRQYRGRAQTLHEKQIERHKKDIKEFWEKAGDAWTKAGDDAKAIEGYQHAAELAGVNNNPDVKRKYVIALLRTARWEIANHELDVALAANPANRGPLIEELDALDKEAKGDDKMWIGKLRDKAKKW